MLKTNLFEILRILTPKEFKEFGEFIKSPYSNKNENVVKLYNYIKSFYPDFDDPGLEKEQVYSAISGKKDYNDGFMRTLIFNLSKLCENFVCNTLRSEIENEITLLDLYFKRGADKLVEKKMRQITDILQKEKTKDQYYFYCLYRIQAQKMAYNSKKRAFLNVKDFHEEDEMQTLDSLLNFYLLAALPEYRFFYNQANVVKLDFEFNFLDEIISFLKRSGFHKKTPELNLHFSALLLAKEDSEKYYYDLKEIALNEIDNYRFGVQFNTIGLLANKAVREYFNGKDKFLEERFEIHNIIIEKGLYKKFEDGFFDDMLFKNIVIVGLQLNKIEWTEKFINDYIDKINPEDKENAFHLNTARLLIYKNRFDEALAHLNYIKNVNHVHYKTEMKILSLIIFYEQNNFVSALGVIDNYRHFLSNDALIPDIRKERNYNFLKFTNDLIKVKENGVLNEAFGLEFEIKNTPNTYEKEWLLKKTKELIKNLQ
ncbi:MAG: hypothetical protein K1X86_01310 [Ignavibacteria bacterium]|nr:hypothetical protein [Ignavibacteria bacterium]